MKSQSYFGAVGLICLMVVGQMTAQKDTKEQAPTKTVGVKADLLVVDAADRYVGDIKQSDIKIFEDGVEQKLTYFGAKETDLGLAFVMDNTGSVRMHLDQMVAMAKIITTNLGAKDEGLVVRFVGRDKIFIEQLWTSDKSLLNETFDNFYVEGGQSAVIDGLYLTVDEVVKRAKKIKNRRYAIVLISDCDDRNSYYGLKDVFPLIEGSDVPVYVVAITQDLSDRPREDNQYRKNVKTNAEKLALNAAFQTGGRAFILGAGYSADDIRETLKSLIPGLRSNYLIRYTSTNSKRDGTPRKLIVEIADGPRGEKRTGIIAPPVVPVE